MLQIEIFSIGCKLLSGNINSAIFPGLQGGPLMHVIAAKAVAFGEALKPDFKTYQENVIENAKILSKTLEERGFRIVTGGTEQYISRLTNFWLNWFAQLEAFREVYFDNKPIVPSNLTLYGGVPQCTGEMDVSQVCLFVQDSVEGEFKQKMSDGWKHWKDENN